MVERVSIFIDGSNFYHSLKRNKIKIRFEDLIEILKRNNLVKDIFYYTAELDKKFDEGRYLEHENFLDNLRKIPNFHVITCNLRKIVLKDGSVEFMIKGDDVHLANDLIKSAFKDNYDIAVIVSGDEDFIPAIKTIQELNKKVVNAYFPKSSSYLLRKCCDESINLKKELKKKSNAENRKGQLLEK